MKNKIKKLIICVICICPFLLTACGEAKAFPQDITSEQILSTAKQAVSNLPSSEKSYTSNGETLDTYKMSLWADGSYEECAEFSCVSEYALYYSADNSTFEISVLKAETESDTEKLVSVFERRKQTLAEGDKAAYDPNFKKLFEDSKILVEGEFVILLITPDNNAAITALENLKE